MLVRVKRDQVQLTQIAPTIGLPTKFHELAMATIDYETSVLVNLVSFYPSSEVQMRGPEFERFPAEFADAKRHLTLVTDTWAEAQTGLRSLIR